MMPEGMENSPSKYTVDRSHAETPARVVRTSFAPAPRDTQRLDDYAHFSRDGVEGLGTSMHRAYAVALTNTGSAAPMRPQNASACRSGSTVRAAWEAPLSRVTSYRVEYQMAGGEWVPVERAWPMYPYETFTIPAGDTQVRITAINGTAESAPTLPIPVIGA